MKVVFEDISLCAYGDVVGRTAYLVDIPDENIPKIIQEKIKRGEGIVITPVVE